MKAITKVIEAASPDSASIWTDASSLHVLEPFFPALFTSVSVRLSVALFAGTSPLSERLHPKTIRLIEANWA